MNLDFKELQITWNDWAPNDWAKAHCFSDKTKCIKI